jgi:hypothetical protein
LREGVVEDSDNVLSTCIQVPVLNIKEKEPHTAKKRPVLRAAKCSLDESENEEVPPKQVKVNESRAAVLPNDEHSSPASKIYLRNIRQRLGVFILHLVSNLAEYKM